MNSVASNPALIGLDWGTSSLRAFLIGAEGEVLEQVSRPQGIMHVEDGDFETTGGTGAGGLLLPSMCIAGPAAGGAGVYQITIAWRGSAAMTSGNNDTCGAAGGQRQRPDRIHPEGGGQEAARDRIRRASSR